ncbi:MAG: diguanylate cyclase [Solirubrobacterales bacterium]|nr:diguanylate cyclase [Solirubrobacterales bacterium]
MSGLCVREERVLRSDDPRVDGAACKRVNAASMICVPLAHHGQTIGVLKADDCFRIGGDEFAIVMPGTNEEEATIAATRIAEEIRAAAFGEDEISASFGIATSHDRRRRGSARRRRPGAAGSQGPALQPQRHLGPLDLNGRRGAHGFKVSLRSRIRSISAAKNSASFLHSAASTSMPSDSGYGLPRTSSASSL